MTPERIAMRWLQALSLPLGVEFKPNLLLGQPQIRTEQSVVPHSDATLAGCSLRATAIQVSSPRRGAGTVHPRFGKEREQELEEGRSEYKHASDLQRRRRLEGKDHVAIHITQHCFKKGYSELNEAPSHRPLTRIKVGGIRSETRASE